MENTETITRFALFSTARGQCGIAWRGNSVIATQLPEATANATAARLASRARASEGLPPSFVERAIGSIQELLEGGKTDLSFIACDFSDLDRFSTAVYVATRTIPPGETLTYGDIAQQLGNKRFAQNVGKALGRNPMPIVVPCHRVVGANGKLTGFSAYGGVDTKSRMLRIEGALMPELPGLFDDLVPAQTPKPED